MHRIWIDLDNTPHVPFFAPMIAALQRRGHSVLVTARDAFQVRELADYFGLRYTLIGRHYGKHMSLKLIGLGIRALQLLPSAARARPHLAISHGSRSQLVVSTLLRIPSLMITDYEHTTDWVGIRPTWVMAPDVIPMDSVRMDPRRLLSYPGIKEDVYVPFFEPDVTTRKRLGFADEQIVVLIRPPATDAHYHNPEAEQLLAELIKHLSGFPNVRMLLVPRNSKQKLWIETEWSSSIQAKKIVFPDKIEDGLNLIWSADLVVSGGGTMNREAAALKVPVYSIFRGPMGAVDRSLAAQGRLTMLTSSEDIQTKLAVVPRQRDSGGSARVSSTMDAILDHVMRILHTTGKAGTTP